MIIITNTSSPIDISTLPLLEKEIFLLKNKSNIHYMYDSIEELKFELKLRSQIIAAARSLNSSKVGFATFKTSRCNDQYWSLTAKGGFQLKKEVLPSHAIQDIFINGHEYAFECATAIAIVLYKAVLGCISENRFNVLFADMLLWDWNFDSDLRLISINSNKETYPGDILYFKNPDYSPETPQWQGESVVKLGEDLYYGHGIGIKNANEIINKLNSLRKPDSQQSAFLFEQASFPDFKYLFHVTPQEGPRKSYAGTHLITAKIGLSTYLRI
jgi:protein-glutamine gamma-glutamyltransferase